jgi:predicted DNA-binding transcriptional regulator AlpA
MKQVEPIKRRLLNIQEVAEYTGLSVHTLYGKAGRLTKFDLRLLDEWIAKNTFMPLKKPEGGVSAKPENILD